MQEYHPNSGARMILFDFDSTIVAVETLDELIRLSLEERDDATETGRVMHEVRMIGDGSTDLRTWEDKATDDFIGFGAHCVRERVRAEAPRFCADCAGLTKLLFPLPA